jgi:hypothetical protein
MVKPCKVTYGGKEYSIEEYLGILHDGLLDQMVKDGIIDDSNFVKKAESVERTDFDTEEEAELYAISKETDPNVIAAKYFTLPELEQEDYKDFKIAEAFSGKKPYKITAQEWAEYGGDKEIPSEIKKYISKEKGDIDDFSETISRNIGVTVTPEDIVGFLVEYGSQAGFKKKKVSNVQQALLERYFDLTGKKQITDEAAKKGFETVVEKNKIAESRYAQKQRLEEVGITEEDIAREQEFASEGFGELETPLEKFEYQKKQISKKGKTELEINKEIFAKAKEMAAAIRGAKIDGKGKAFDATLGLPVAIWNGAIETVATAIEAGVAVADAIKRGLNYIQKNNRGQWNKKAYNDRVIAELGLRGIEVNGEDLIVQPLEDKATVELVNGFYSPLEKGISEAKTDKATGKGWMKVLSGVTEGDELNYTGVKAFLESNADRPIGRKELLDYMKDNRIEIVEVVKGELSKEEITEKDRLEEELNSVGRKITMAILKKDDDTVKELRAKEKELFKQYEPYSDKTNRGLTKFEQYQLEGEKENYKEVLVTLPRKSNLDDISDKLFSKKYTELNASERVSVKREARSQGQVVDESNTFRSSHFDEPNILVHLRMNTRTDADGNKVLFLEEVQSDWGQKGKREGFNEPLKIEIIEVKNNRIVSKDGKVLLNTFSDSEIQDWQIERASKESGIPKQDLKTDKSISYKATVDGKKVAGNHLTKEDARKNAIEDASKIGKSTIPSAPFVTDTNAWTKLGLKTALKEAVAQGADKLAWTTGEQQNDRYDLSKSVDQISIAKQPNGNDYVVVGVKDNNVIVNRIAKESELEGIVGKEIASKAINEGQNVFKGKDLAVGGKGMKGFYGSPTEGSLGIVGNVAKSLFGQVPKTVDIDTEIFDIKKIQYLADKYDVAASMISKAVREEDLEQQAEIGLTKDEVKVVEDYLKGTSTQYSIDITPELKQAVKEGIPLFKNELTQAKEKLKEASAALSKLNKNLGIYSDPEQNARALFEYHKALVGLAKAYIKEGVNSVKDFAKELGENLTQEIKDAWNEANGKSKKTLSDFKAEIDTSLINEEVKLKRDIYGFDEPLLRETKPNPELLEEAIQNIKDGESVYDIIDKVNNGEPLTDVETVMLAQFQGTKEAELYKINKKIEQSKDSSPLEFDKSVQKRNEIIDDLIASYDASELSGTVTGRALQARKVRVLQDYSLANMLIRVRKANNNRNLTNEQINEVTDRYNELIEAEAKLKAKVEQLTKENENLKLAKSEARLRKEAVSDIKNRNRAEVKEALKKERSSILEDISKAIQRSRGKISMNPFPDEVFPLIGKLAKNYYLDGITSIEAIVDKVYEDVKDLVEGVTKRDVRDAISGYGRDTRPTQDDLQRELFDLREQAKLISRIEDAEAGAKKAKDERVKRVASDESKKLRARLKDLTKEEASLEAIKKSLKRRIDETKTKLDKKDYSRPQKVEIELDDEAKKLQEAYRKIKFEFDVAVEKDKLANRTQSEKWQDIALEVFNLPRALMATADLSAPLRQGLLPTLANPVMASKAFVEMLRQWNSKDVADTWLADLKDSPGYQLMQQSGLYIADRTNAKVTAKEEDFQSNFAERAPIIGRGFKVGKFTIGEVNIKGKKIGNIDLVGRSERAYVAYLNKMRADLFTKGVNVLQNDGISFASNPKAYKALATYINASTGRGNLGMLEKAAPILNATFFSPRLMASRVQLLTNWANPLFYKNTPAAVRKMYFKDMGTFIAFGMGILALAALSGADTEEDPRSPDFGKIRSGNTRWDIWGGFQQFVRYTSQIATGEKKSTASDKITPLDGSSYTKETRMSVIGNFVRSKLAPVPSAIVDYLYGENMIGDPFNLSNMIISRAIPLVWQGVYESAKQDGWAKALLVTGVPSILGIGVQTYGLNDFLEQGVDNKSIKLLIDKKAVAIEPKETERTVIDAITGEKRKMDDDEFEKYYASWADYIKKDLKENYDEYNKMSPEKFEDEFRKIKSNATSYAKEQVTSVIPETLTLEIDNVTYKLTPDKVAERKDYIQEYIDDKEDSRSFERKIEKLIEKGSIKDTPSEIKKILMSDAKEYATKKMKKDYEDNPEELGAVKD